MKIKTIDFNNKKKEFIVGTSDQTYLFPYSRADIIPSARNKVQSAYIDPEIGREGFSYLLEDGREGTVLMDSVLDYNSDPNYMQDLLLYNLTIEAQKRIDNSDLTKREIIRRLASSPAQLYRLLDQSNTKKHIEQMIKLLAILDCEVDIVVKKRKKMSASMSLAKLAVGGFDCSTGCTTGRTTR